MRKIFQTPIFYNLLAFGLLLSFHLGNPFVPVTGVAGLPRVYEVSPSLPGIDDFASQVATGGTSWAAGVYLEGVLALPVVAQPAGQPGYVSEEPGVATHFAYVDQYGSLGLLAHNYLAGAAFFDIEVNNLITVVYGDGSRQVYQVQQITRYQAVESKNPYSDFIDLEDGSRLSASDLFYRVYGVDGRLVLQTCIEAEGDDSWGRLFVIAVPYSGETAPVSVNSLSWPDILRSFLN